MRDLAMQLAQVMWWTRSAVVFALAPLSLPGPAHAQDAGKERIYIKCDLENGARVSYVLDKGKQTVEVAGYPQTALPYVEDEISYKKLLKGGESSPPVVTWTLNKYTLRVSALVGISMTQTTGQCEIVERKL